MKQHNNGLRDEIINKIIKLIEKKFPKNQQNYVKKFANSFFANVSIEDLSHRNIIDLYGSLVTNWNFIHNYTNKKSKVRVYNPKMEEHGWQSSHTIIEILSNDMPFLVDSVRQALNQIDVTNHLMIFPDYFLVTRDKEGNLIDFDINQNPNKEPECLVKGKCSKESIVYVEINKQTNIKKLQELKKYIEGILLDVTIAVKDWPNMKKKAEELIEILEQTGYKNKKELKEAQDFITWMLDDKFTFIACCDYNYTNKNGKGFLEFIGNSGLGFLSKKSRYTIDDCFKGLPRDGEKIKQDPRMIVINKSSLRSTVHRPVDLDFITVKIYDEKQNLKRVRIFLGLYTSVAYNTRPQTIPYLRHKISEILKLSNLENNNHSLKELLNILETYPREDLFQASVEDLFEISMGILDIQERPMIRLFLRKDTFNRFISALVFVPREKYTTRYRKIIENILLKDLEGSSVSFSTRFSESILARMHITIKLKNYHVEPVFDQSLLQQKIIDAGRTWDDNLQDALLDYYGEERGLEVLTNFSESFPAGYCDMYSAWTAVYDVEHLCNISEINQLELSFYKPLEEIEGHLRFKLYRKNSHIPLSDVLPILENLGMRVLSENTHCITANDGSLYWINDFLMIHQDNLNFDIDKIKVKFQDCFHNVWNNRAENDAFNKLVLYANIDWHEVSVLRAYTKYLRQIGFTFSETYIQETIVNNFKVAKNLVKLFLAKFNLGKNVSKSSDDMETEIKIQLEEVNNIDEDRILNRFLSVIQATLRTNYFQKIEVNNKKIPKDYLSFKLSPELIPEMPLPLPLYEIFVYSTRVEGVHLRGGKVARGGLRWSDRREDFRTEILGLMKAQQVKNSVIVPAGAKGGFVCKQLPSTQDRDVIYQEVVNCYSTFIKGLLDITDNLVSDKVVTPKNTVILDEQDSYLVVAADKGTATFSDIANKISCEYGFWLGDAFASGGSAGYDHKQMGITARGAWESVKRHFFTLGKNIETDDFTVVGIGDMAGDVFGNGMLLSRKIKLIAAFNHMHIFIDPNPDPEVSFKERKRLFDMPRSTWLDYNPELISAGGGIYSRHVKSIKLTKEAQKALGIKEDRLDPNALIKAILKAKVDLLWNGGIGTYVKSQTESNIDVGDRSNDAVRVNGKELRCKIIGEGGNLGLTQLGRVEASFAGRTLFTDFIDNSAGVDCSDHEVNIKILLNNLVQSGDMTEKQRNKLLEQMTEEVAQLVLKNNFNQDRFIAIAAIRSKSTIDEYVRFIKNLEKQGKINRELEYLPSDEEINSRKAREVGFTRPEIAVLVAYSKNILKQKIKETSVIKDKFFESYLESAFPSILRKNYKKEMQKHKLRREIIAMQLSNDIINKMGITYVDRLYDETGADIDAIIMAHIISVEIFNLNEIFDELSALDGIAEPSVQVRITNDLIRLVRRSSRWFLRNYRNKLDINLLIKNFKPKVNLLWKDITKYLRGSDEERSIRLYDEYTQANISDNVASKMCHIRPLFSSLDVINIAESSNLDIDTVASLYYAVGSELKLGWFRGEISSQPVNNHWDALTRSACRDDVDYYQSAITMGILGTSDNSLELDEKLKVWLENNEQLVYRWSNLLLDIKSSPNNEFTKFSIAIRELLDLSQACS